MKSLLVTALLVGSGGFAGAVFRYGLAGIVQRQVPLSTFPYGTLAVNLLGSLLIGVIGGWVDSRQVFTPEMRAFILIGLLGGFTTFSTLSYEGFAMIRDGEHLRAVAYLGSHVVFGLAAVWLGYGLASAR